MHSNISNQLSKIAPPNLQQLTEWFTGRSQILNKIDEWLQQKDQRFFALTGEPGVGKSAIAAHIIQTRRDIVAYHFCQADNPDTLKPSQILRSLAAQLMKSQTMPGYGTALLNTIKSPTLTAKVKITFKETTNSEITEVFIENLKSSNERKEGQEDLDSLLEVLIRAPLEELVNHQASLPRRAIFLIDGLDVVVSSETAAQDDEDIVTLLSALAEAQNLPSWVRFILTSRPDRRVMREFEPLQIYDSQETVVQESNTQSKIGVLQNCLYRLDEMSVENQKDIRDYIQKRVEQPTVQKLLRTAQISEQDLVETLTMNAKGNFRYVCCVLDEMETGARSPNQLSGLPESLKQIYAQEWFATEPSGKASKSILEAIANAETFLTEDELVRKTGLRPRLVRQALWGLRQFLDVGTKPDPESTENSAELIETVETFAIFHPSLREYLLTCNLK